MAESWQQRFKREVQEMDAAVLAVLARGLEDEALRDALEELPTRPWFRELFWLWGPAVATSRSHAEPEEGRRAPGRPQGAAVLSSSDKPSTPLTVCPMAASMK